MVVSSVHMCCYDGPAACILSVQPAFCLSWFMTLQQWLQTEHLSTCMQQMSQGNTACAACELDMLTQEEAAARLQAEVGALQQLLSNERNLVVEAQSIISTTQVLWLPILCSLVQHLLL